MSTETTSGRGLITWATSPTNPDVVQWKHNRARARWQIFAWCANPQDAAVLAHHLAMTNYNPTEQPTQEEQRR